MYLREKISIAAIQERYLLTKKGSSKVVYHIRLKVDASTLVIKPGDSLGIFGQNDATYVNQLLDALQLQGNELIIDPRSKEEKTIRSFFTHKANLTRLTSAFVTLACELESNSRRKQELLILLQKDTYKQYLSTHHPIDFIREYRVTLPPQQLCACFSPLLPRFYSVASSPLAFPNSVDLTVALTTYFHKGEEYYGVASHFLCHLAEVSTTPIFFYVQSAHKFSLPKDQSAPIIMVGPGTGIAPFRAFVQEREHLASTGKNWLFFGERQVAFDFFYEEFWRSLVEKNFLQLSTAFSRDQSQKVYVHHLMLAEAEEFFHWIQEGAYFYVCGEAENMAKDVDKVLREIVSTQAKVSQEMAKEFVRVLKREGRYLIDVY